MSAKAGEGLGRVAGMERSRMRNLNVEMARKCLSLIRDIAESRGIVLGSTRAAHGANLVELVLYFQ